MLKRFDKMVDTVGVMTEKMFFSMILYGFLLTDKGAESNDRN